MEDEETVLRNQAMAYATGYSCKSTIEYNPDALIFLAQRIYLFLKGQ
jgi:hypothetical protein